MIEIKNLLFQPLTFHLAGDGQGLHLNPRERKSIGNEQLSPEIASRDKAESDFIDRDCKVAGSLSEKRQVSREKIQDKIKGRWNAGVPAHETEINHGRLSFPGRLHA